MADLKVHIVQTSLYWENKSANLAHLEELLSEIDETDLIVLPEMFNTGFTMNTSQFSEPMNLTTTRWMQQMAQQKNSVVCGSIIIKESSLFYNRLLFVYPNKKVDFYDKRHLFRMGEENDFFTAGNQQTVFNHKNWNFSPSICYDLRFPAWLRNKNNNYDILINVANWPQSRRNAWKILLQARAIENQSYVLGCNRTGKDKNGIFYSGDSIIVNPKGEIIADAEDKNCIISSVLSLEELNSFRKKFPVSLDADQFNIKF